MGALSCSTLRKRSLLSSTAIYKSVWRAYLKCIPKKYISLNKLTITSEYPQCVSVPLRNINLKALPLGEVQPRVSPDFNSTPLVPSSTISCLLCGSGSVPTQMLLCLSLTLCLGSYTRFCVWFFEQNRKHHTRKD